jgi:hypothetical protein
MKKKKKKKKKWGKLEVKGGGWEIRNGLEGSFSN